MATGRITKKVVDGLVCPPDRDRELIWDDALSGFGVAAFPTGRKTFVAQYRQAGRSRRISLGEYGRLTADEARAKAKKVLGSVANGHDPLGERQADRSVPNFQEVANAYLDRVTRCKKPRTAQAYEGLLRLYLLPALGRKRITEIRSRDVESLHQSMAAHPTAANRALTLFSAVWAWASSKAPYRDLGLPFNPAKGIDKNREESRERFLSSEELARLGDALNRADTVGLPYEIDESRPTAKHAPRPENRVRKVDPFSVAAVRLLLFTGCRLREILHARWEEIDLERGFLNVPSAKSKTGRKSVVLSSPALAVLAALPRLESNPYVICGAKLDADGFGRPRHDLQKPWNAITSAAGLQGLRIHDLRHSFASVGAGASLGLPMIGHLLGHRSPLTTAKYAHLDADPSRRAANTIALSIAASLNNGAEGKSATVLRLRN